MSRKKQLFLEKVLIFHLRCAIIFKSYADVPKWLKGPHSKCGRTAIPSREFKSLHLRHVHIVHFVNRLLHIAKGDCVILRYEEL